MRDSDNLAWVYACGLFASILSIHGATAAAAEAEPRIVALNRDVSVFSISTAPHRATIDTKLATGTTLRTGLNSRAELSFGDQAIARVIGDSRITIGQPRRLELNQGAILCDVRSGASRLSVGAVSVVAEISQATAVLEYRPGFFKFMVLAGTGRIYRPESLGDSLLVQSGQIVFGNPNAALSDPVDFAIERFVQTSGLIRGFRRLSSENAIAEAIQQQQRDQSRKTLIETNLAIFGGGTAVSLRAPQNGPQR